LEKQGNLIGFLESKVATSSSPDVAAFVFEDFAISKSTHINKKI